MEINVVIYLSEINPEILITSSCCLVIVIIHRVDKQNLYLTNVNDSSV